MKEKTLERLPWRFDGKKDRSNKGISDVYTEDRTLVIDCYVTISGKLFPDLRYCMTKKEGRALDKRGDGSWHDALPEFRWHVNSIPPYADPFSARLALFNFAGWIGLKTYTGQDEHSLLYSVSNFIRQEKADNRASARVRRINVRAESVPVEYPEGFNDFMAADLSEDYITINGDKSYCTACGKLVNSKGHKAGEEGKCPKCRHKIIYTRRRLDKVCNKREYACLQETFMNETVIRYVKKEVWFHQGEKKKVTLWEAARTFHDGNFKYICKHIHYFSNYSGSDYWWDAFEPCGQISYGGKTLLFPDNLHGILCEEWVRCYEAMRGTPFNTKFGLHADLPMIGLCERLAKAGMKKLPAQLISDGYYNWPYVDYKPMELKKALGISKDMLRWMIENDGDKGNLLILQDGLKDNHGLNLEEIFVLAKAKISIKALADVSKKNKLMKTLTYLRKTKGFKSLAETLDHYKDYLSMCRQLEYDLSRDTTRYPADLKEKHDRLVTELNAVKKAMEEKEKNKRFKKIAARYKSLTAAYGFKDKTYEIIAPVNAADIVEEGHTLHHCVGGDNYLKKHAEGQSAILFMRRIKDPGSRYYTIEIIGTQVKQYYGINDSKPDKLEVDRFLAKWKKHLEKELRDGKYVKQLSAV